MNRRSKGWKGFSLPELMVAAAIFSLLVLLTTMILRGGGDQVRLAETKMHLQESVRESLYRMGLEIRESSPSRVTISNGGAVLTFLIPQTVGNAGVITWSNPITYQIGGSGSQLIRTDTGTGQTTVLANDIASVSFSTTGNPVGIIAMTVTAQRNTTNGRTLTETSSGEARLRNG